VDTFSDTTLTDMYDSEYHIEICWAREFIVLTTPAIINYLPLHTMYLLNTGIKFWAFILLSVCVLKFTLQISVIIFQTPRIMEGRTDSKISGELLLQGAEANVEADDKVN